jgi:hypothetical protein
MERLLAFRIDWGQSMDAKNPSQEAGKKKPTAQ